MPDWCQVIMRRGGVEVALDECTFQLPVHLRGTKPAKVTIKQGGQRMAELEDLARAEGVLEIEVWNPNDAGQFVPSRIRSWDVEKVQKGPGDACRLFLVEGRRELAWHTCTQDINLKRWTGYVPGTAGYQAGGAGSENKAIDIPATLREALQKICELPPFTERMLSTAFDEVSDEAIRDDIFIAGLQMDKAVEVLEQVTGLDIVLDPSTRLYMWQARQDNTGSLSAAWQTHGWLQQPGWLDRATQQTGKPDVLIGQYRKRQTLHVVNKDYYDRTTGDFVLDQFNIPGVPKVVFENVYDFAGRWMTLPQMLEAAGYPRNALGDPDGPTGRGNVTSELTIATNIMEDNWVDTALFFGKRPSTVEKGIDAIVRKAIKDGWRKYYALRFLNDNGKNLWGGYSEVNLGEENVGGGFRAGQVFVGWTEVLPKAEADETRVAGRTVYRMIVDHAAGLTYPDAVLEEVPFPWTGYDGTKYSALAVSPFKLEWKDKDNGIVWVKANASRIRGSTAFVGRPTQDSLKALSRGVGKTSNANENDINEIAGAQIDAFATNAVRALKFKETYDLHAYISAIVEAPQGIDGVGSRFYEIRREYGGDIPEIRLPVPESPVAIFGAGTSDLPINLEETFNDYQRRAADFLYEVGARAQGPGETLDVHLVVPRTIDREMVGSELRVNENVITCVVEMGNEGNPSARARNAAKREAGRKFKLAGKDSG